MNTKIVEAHVVVVHNDRDGFRQYHAIPIEIDWVIEEELLLQTAEHRRLQLTIRRWSNNNTSDQSIVGIVQVPLQDLLLLWLLVDLTKVGSRQVVGVAESSNDGIGNVYLFE